MLIAPSVVEAVEIRPELLTVAVPVALIAAPRLAATCRMMAPAALLTVLPAANLTVYGPPVLVWRMPEPLLLMVTALVALTAEPRFAVMKLPPVIVPVLVSVPPPLENTTPPYEAAVMVPELVTSIREPLDRKMLPSTLIVPALLKTTGFPAAKVAAKLFRPETTAPASTLTVPP